MAMYSLKLSSADVFQILDALTSRANSYQQTACFIAGQCEANETIFIEECRDAVDAQEIAQHYRDITKSIECQI